MRRNLHRLGSILLVGGVLAIAWSIVVWRWQDPVTMLYTHYEQHRLAAQLEKTLAAQRANTVAVAVQAPAAPAAPAAPSARAIAAAARRFRLAARPGQPIGRLVIPRLGLSYVVVEGTDSASLRLGPGRDERSFMPGESNLVYIAGHRTTFAAPFAHIDEIRPGDAVRLQMPYGTFFYVVTGHSIVAADDLRVLRPRHRELLALQACHPRFFATERYIVWARLRRVVTPAGALVEGLTAG